MHVSVEIDPTMFRLITTGLDHPKKIPRIVFTGIEVTVCN